MGVFFYQGQYLFNACVELPYKPASYFSTPLSNAKQRADFNILELASNEQLPNVSVLNYRHGLAELAAQGNTAYIRFNSPIALHNKQLFIYRFVVPALLKQQGLIVLHATAIVIGGQLTLILGRSGSGKSLYAANKIKQGAQLYADDLLFIKQQGNQLMASGGQPLLHLNEITFKELGINKADTHPVHDSTKRAVEASLLGRQQVTKQLPITRLVVLVSGKAVELSKVERLKLLLDSEYKTPWATENAADYQQKLNIFALLAKMSQNTKPDSSS